MSVAQISVEPLLWPLVRLVLGLLVGLFVANLLEGLNWMRFFSSLATPLARAAHLGGCASAAFAMAFLSPNQANAILSEGFEKQALSLRELLLANLFNSLPAYFVHTPSLFFLLWPVLGVSALIYVGLCLLSALLRTMVTLFFARILLPKKPLLSVTPKQMPKSSLRQVLIKAAKRLKKRVPKLLLATVPIYFLISYLQIHGHFQALQAWIGSNPTLTYLLPPEALGIVSLHLLAELGAALGACSALLATSDISQSTIILALLLGNILSTPLRALRHQLPAYAGLYSPKLGLLLIFVNQSLRALTMVLITSLYVLWLVHAS